VDQLAGCSLEDAKTVLAEAAALHAYAGATRRCNPWTGWRPARRGPLVPSVAVGQVGSRFSSAIRCKSRRPPVLCHLPGQSTLEGNRILT